MNKFNFTLYISLFILISIFSTYNVVHADKDFSHIFFPAESTCDSTDICTYDYVKVNVIGSMTQTESDGEINILNHMRIRQEDPIMHSSIKLLFGFPEDQLSITNMDVDGRSSDGLGPGFCDTDTNATIHAATFYPQHKFIECHLIANIPNTVDLSFTKNPLSDDDVIMTVFNVCLDENCAADRKLYYYFGDDEYYVANDLYVISGGPIQILNYDANTLEFKGIIAKDYTEQENGLRLPTDMTFSDDELLYITDFGEAKIKFLQPGNDVIYTFFEYDRQYPKSLTFGPDLTGDYVDELYVLTTSSDELGFPTRDIMIHDSTSKEILYTIPINCEEPRVIRSGPSSGWKADGPSSGWNADSIFLTCAEGVFEIEIIDKTNSPADSYTFLINRFDIPYYQTDQALNSSICSIDAPLGLDFFNVGDNPKRSYLYEGWFISDGQHNTIRVLYSNAECAEITSGNFAAYPFTKYHPDNPFSIVLYPSILKERTSEEDTGYRPNETMIYIADFTADKIIMLTTSGETSFGDGVEFPIMNSNSGGLSAPKVITLGPITGIEGVPPSKSIVNPPIIIQEIRLNWVMFFIPIIIIVPIVWVMFVILMKITSKNH